MTATVYRVDYHLICVIHFSDETPSGPDLAEMWTSLAALGVFRADQSVFRRGQTGHLQLGVSPLGSPKLSEMLIAKGGEILSVCASSFRRNAGNAILDSDVNFSYSQCGVRDRLKQPPIIKLSISGQVMEQVGSEVVLGILRRFFEIADKYSPSSGLVDVAHPEDAYAGMVYGTAFPFTAPLYRRVEMINWTHSGASKGDRLRGVYWGNYLGPKMLSRLDGKDKFFDRYEQYARNYDKSPIARCWSMSNGVFISLCLDPLGCRPGRPAGLNPTALLNLKWLLDELGPKGILNLW